MGDYVISIKRVRNYSGEECEPYWEYTSYDRYAGALSSGYPCFDHLNHAIKYNSVKEAEESFKSWWSGFVYGHRNYHLDYDISTLAIRKITFNTKKKLEVC